MHRNICKICGQVFDSKYKNSKVCEPCKNRPCEVCGKPFKRIDPYDQHTCSKECRMIWYKDPVRNAEKTAKRKATNLEKYGVDNVAKLDSIKTKLSDIRHTEEYREKIKQTSLINYGIEDYRSSPEFREKARQGQANKAKSEMQSDTIRGQLIAAAQSTTSIIVYDESTITKIISEFEQKCEKHIERNFQLDDMTYSMHIEGTNILLNIDDTRTHCNLPTTSTEGIANDYHDKLTQVAQEHGYKCIHIFDWDNLDKIAKLISPRTNVYARNCKLERLTAAQVHQFINKNHLQGDARGANHCYALIYKGELLAAMTFGKPRYNKKYEWELLRLCTAESYNVIGGASKMLKAFIKDVDPKSIISYCDRAKFSGDVYYKIGMKLSHVSPPTKVWSKDNKYITDNLLRQRGFDQIFNTSYGKGTSNELLMIQEGWRPIYDCGQMVFELKR